MNKSENLNLTGKNEEAYEFESDPPSEMLTNILAIYPFLNEQEKNEFVSKVKGINENEDLSKLDEMKKMIEILNNPHARIDRIKNNDEFSYKEKHKVQTDKDKFPTAEMIDSVLYLKIPTFWGINFEDHIKEIFNYNKGKSEGLIIDLRGNRGGQMSTGKELSKSLIREGEHYFGLTISRKPESDIDTIKKSNYASGMTNFYRKPIVVLTNTDTFSASERFIARLKSDADKDLTLIGTETMGGSAYPEETMYELNGEKYSVLIPRWRFFLPGKDRPLEETKIEPNIYHDKEDIVDFAIEYIKSKANKEAKI